MTNLSLHFDYPVVFTRSIFDRENDALVHVISRKERERIHRVLVVLERAVFQVFPKLPGEIAAYFAAHGKHATLVSSVPLVLDGGERAKTSIEFPMDVASRLNDLGMDRQSVVVIIGGGALLDMVGFAASITHRGLRVVRVPTTVLAQADSAVGVKNGINAFGKKNFLGSFAPPFGVVVDSLFLTTLPKRDRVSGMAEAVKVALVRDASFYSWIEGHREALARGSAAEVEGLIRRSADLHLEHIARSGDPFELGLARPLDFGHWSAHKLESLSAYELRHGEAVAIGIALDTILSAELGLLDHSFLEPILRLLETLGFSLWHDTLERTTRSGERSVLDGLREFREHIGGELTITLLPEIGRGCDVHAIDERLVLEGIALLKKRGVRGG